MGRNKCQKSAKLKELFDGKFNLKFNLKFSLEFQVRNVYD